MFIDFLMKVNFISFKFKIRWLRMGYFNDLVAELKLRLNLKLIASLNYV